MTLRTHLSNGYTKRLGKKDDAHYRGGEQQCDVILRCQSFKIGKHCL